MTILITGGSGFIGSFLARHLLDTTEIELILLDYSINQKRITDLEKNPRVHVIQGDISCWSELVSLCTQFDQIDA
ncbi:MAG: NAD-dependent epimerase/dehydratase family protein, partial [Candidatus Hodarchaeales archaeon]